MKETTTQDPAALDAEEVQLGFGKGGVPWYLMVFYLSFLTFFVWYTLEYQLPGFLDQGPGSEAAATEQGPAHDAPAPAADAVK